MKKRNCYLRSEMPQDIECMMEEIGRLQDEIKKEIDELQKRQRKLETYERWLKAEERVTEHIIEDLRICVFSEEDEERYRNRVFIRDMTIFYLNKENEIVDTKEGFAIIPNEIPQEGSYCAKCEKNKTVHIPKAYVCEWNGTDCISCRIYIPITAVLGLLISGFKSKEKTKAALKKAWNSFANIFPEISATLILIGIILAILTPEQISSVLGDGSGVIHYIISPQTGEKATLSVWKNLKEMLSLLPPIFLLIGLLDVWIPKETMVKYLGSHAGIKGVIIAHFMSIILKSELEE